MEHGVTLKTVVKTVEILELLMGYPEGATLKEISAAVRQSPSTVHHLLNTMRQLGLLQQNPETKHYRLGLKAYQIGQAALQHLDLAKRAQPHMRELARQTEEGISLVQYEAGSPVYVIHIESTRAIGARFRPGASIPLHCTGSGKIFLSSLTEPDLDALLPTLELTPYTPKTITDTARLREETLHVRAQGYAVDDEEVEEGMICIAAPVRDHQGTIIGSISLSGPSSRVGEKRDDLIARTSETAKSVSFKR